MNPVSIVSVEDLSDDTLRQIISHLEISREFEHYIHREAELDGVWRLADMALKDETDERKRAWLRARLDIAMEAHDLVADSRPQDAADRLKSAISG